MYLIFILVQSRVAHPYVVLFLSLSLSEDSVSQSVSQPMIWKKKVMCVLLFHSSRRLWLFHLTPMSERNVSLSLYFALENIQCELNAHTLEIDPPRTRLNSLCTRVMRYLNEFVVVLNIYTKPAYTGS